MNLALSHAMTKPDVDKREEFWRAVVSRDRRMDGQFVVAVKSTRIYCRPSCPARKPLRKNVTFFALPEAAEQAGFRACKRCRPQDSLFSDPQVEMVRRVCQYVRENPTNSLELAELSSHAGVSAFHLQRTFKSIMGVSPREYATAERFRSFKSKVREGNTVTNALYDAGLNSSRSLYERSGDELGMTPATYGRHGRGANITFTIADCSFGRLLVAMTNRGLCSLTIGDDDKELELGLRNEFFAAQIERADSEMERTIKGVLDLLEDKLPHQSLPLDIRATAFQRQVWEKLRSIPFGETMSYGDVAKALGKPGAVRAVGRACATNPVALVIPCHRVVREDKSLGGYRWGLEIKKKILDHEAGRKG